MSDLPSPSPAPEPAAEPTADAATAAAAKAAPIDELDKYAVRGHRQIRVLLQELINTRALVTVRPKPQHSFVSMLLGLVENEDAVLVDASSDPALNELALQSSRLHCISQLGKIRIQFALDGVDAEDVDGRAVFNAWVPEVIYRFQRRDFFRLETPLSARPLCILSTAIAGELTQLQAPVVDIGGGGLAVILLEEEGQFSIGQRLRECSLQLAAKVTLPIQLEVRNLIPVRYPSGVTRIRVGFVFVDLSPDASARLERYILNTQRERSARQPYGL